MAKEWHYAKDGETHGPVTSQQLKKLATSGELQPTDLVWTEGNDEWKPASGIKGLFPTKPDSPTPPPVPGSTNTAKIDTAPALWNPTAIRLWSLLFTWGFGGFLMAQNWKSLGKHEKAKKSMIWFYSIFGFIFLGVITPDDDFTMKIFRFVGLGVLAAWSIFSAQPQINYIKEHFGNDYQRRSWGKPIGIVSACLCFLLAFAVLPTLLGTPAEILTVRYGKLDAYPGIGLGNAIDEFLSDPEWSVIESEDGTHIVNISGGITYQEKPVRALLQFLVVDDRFEFTALEFNGIVQNEIIRMALMNKMMSDFIDSSGSDTGDVVSQKTASQVTTLSDSEIVDFIDNTKKYKGKVLRMRLGIFDTLRAGGIGLHFFRYTFVGGSPIRLDMKIRVIPSSSDDLAEFDSLLDLPNVKSPEEVVVTFLCEEGTLGYGNRAIRIERP